MQITKDLTVTLPKSALTLKNECHPFGVPLAGSGRDLSTFLPPAASKPPPVAKSEPEQTAVAPPALKLGPGKIRSASTTVVVVVTVPKFAGVMQTTKALAVPELLANKTCQPLGVPLATSGLD
jgi:hypothetical protein